MAMFRWLTDPPWMGKLNALVRVFFSLRGRLLALALIATCPGFLLVIYTNSAWKRHDVKDTNRYAMGLARLTATEIEHVVEASRDLLSSVAQIPAVRAGDALECPKILSALRNGFPYYATLGVIQTNGDITCSAVPSPVPVNVRDRHYFRKAMETRGFAVGDFVVGRITQKASFQVVTPVFDGDDIRALMLGSLDLEWFAGNLGVRGAPAGTTITVLDRNGVILVRNPAQMQAVGSSALTVPAFRTMLRERRANTTHAEDLDGVQRLLAFMPIAVGSRDGDLYVVVGVPLAEAFAEADSVLFHNLVGLGGMGAVVLLLTWLAADIFVLRQVKAVRRAARRLSAGDLAVRTGLSKGSDDLSQLANAFDTMAAEIEARHADAERAKEALREANEELERRVQERTVHLAVANEAQQIALRDLKRAQDHLDEQQAQLAGIIDSAMEAIISLDEDYRVLVFNREAERVFRVPASEAIGRTVDRFIPERFRATHMAGLRLLGKQDGTGERIGPAGSAFALRADGEEFPIEAAASSVEVRGEMLYTIIIRDVSERLKTEDMVRKLSLAVEQTTESVFITDRNGVIEYVNPAFERLTGYRRADAIGQTPRILSSGTYEATFYEEMWKTILSGRVWEWIFVNRKKDGERYHELQTITPIRDEAGHVTHFVASGRDVTQRRRTEEALRRLNTQLEREAERIAHTLHDEAGPLLTSAHITLAEVARDLPPSAQERLSGVREHLDGIEQHLRRLSHELRPRILDDLGLEAAVEFLVDGFMKRTGIAVTLDASLDGRLPPVVETTVYRVVQEALTNAAKHARPTRIHVQFAHDGKAVRCAVRDNGAGFDVADVLARRGEPSLGLVGTGDRVEALGGTLGIASVPGEGTELLVVLPVEQEEA